MIVPYLFSYVKGLSMDDTTKPKSRGIAEKSPMAAGASEVQITTAMISAGAQAVAECLDDPCVSYCELVARVAFEAMKRAEIAEG
jgi:hypothetical protein